MRDVRLTVRDEYGRVLARRDAEFGPRGYRFADVVQLDLQMPLTNLVGATSGRWWKRRPPACDVALVPLPARVVVELDVSGWRR